jgi:protein-S-isoprenylcysteine O-methyltransferase Ste14
MNAALFFLGITLIIEFWLYLVILLVFQISVHYLILSEERWCMETFGEEYKNYIQHVRRYI